MRTLFCLVLLTLGFLSAQAQEENYIRMVGNSEISFKATGLKITMDLKEIKRDEYQKIREKSISEIKTELLANLARMGYKESDLEEVWPPANRYNREKKETYTLEVDSKEKAKEISKLEIGGFSCTQFKYIYDQSEKFDTYPLSMQAIDDAHRKAKALASKVGKKIGKVINITDKTSSKKISPPRNSDTETFSYSYSLTITYELLD